MPANTEDLIELTGGCGLFQILHTVSIYMCRVLAVCGLNMMIFGNFNPGWNCDQPLSTSMSTHNSSVEYSNTELLSSMHCSNISQCSEIHFLSNGKTPVSEWTLICDRMWSLSLISSMQMIGTLIGSIVAGYVSENMGRRVCLYGNLLVFTLSNFIIAFSNSWEMYAGINFFIGFSAGGINPTGTIYTMEFLTPKWRGIFGGLPIVNIGIVLYSVMIYFERDWRFVHISTAVVSSAMLFTWCWVSESMRWLAVHGKTESAKRVVERMAKYNRTSVPEMDAIDRTAQEELENKMSNIYTYRDLFRSRQSCILNSKLMLIWVSIATAFVSISFSLGALPGDFYTNFIITCALEIPIVAINGVLLNRCGRIKAGSLYFGLSLIFFVTALSFSLSGQLPKQHRVFSILPMLTIGLLAGAMAVVQLSSTELLATNNRAIGLSLHQTVAGLGTTVAPFLIKGEIFSMDAFLILQSILILIATLIFISLPETKDKAMNDTAQNVVGLHDDANDATFHEENNPVISTEVIGIIQEHASKGVNSYDTIMDERKSNLLSHNRR